MNWALSVDKLFINVKESTILALRSKKYLQFVVAFKKAVKISENLQKSILD